MRTVSFAGSVVYVFIIFQSPDLAVLICWNDSESVRSTFKSWIASSFSVVIAEVFQSLTKNCSVCTFATVTFG